MLNKFKLLVSLMIVFCGTPAIANVLGDMQTFAPSTDGIDFITVQSSRTLKKGMLATGGHVTAARNSLLVYRTLNNQDRLDYKDIYSDADVNLAYGLTDTFQLSLATNTILYHESDKDQEVDASLSTGLRVIRPGFKWNFSRKNQWTGLASVDFINATNDPYTGTPAKPIYNLELVKNFRNKAVFHGFNIGYRFRQVTTTPSDAALFPLHDQFILSYGLAAPFVGKLRWIGEITGAIPVDSKPYKNQSDATALDFLLGVKYRLAERFNFDFGATTQPFVRNLSPTARIFGGLVYYWDFSSKKADAAAPADVSRVIVSPQNLRLQPGQSYRLAARGGVRPYTYSIKSGKGELDPNGGNFTASTEPGTTTVTVQDSAGNASEAVIEVAASGSRLSLYPEEATMFGGTKMKLTAGGGKEPYSYKVLSGKGSVDESGYFLAPEDNGTTVLQVSDAQGNTAQSKIEVSRLTQPDKVISLGGLNFYLNSDLLVPESKTTAIQLVNQLKELNFSHLVISGHTDSTGPLNHNFTLSEQRADTIKSLLIQELGIDENRIRTVGFGPSRPVTSNKTEDGRSKNRRVEILVYK